MLLVPSIVVVSMEEMNKLVFKFMFLELLPLGICKIYVCRIENNDVKQKKPPHKLPLLPPRLSLNHPLTLSNSLSVHQQYGLYFFGLNSLCAAYRYFV